ncbi:hypothetical protein EVAR_54192_1 [Eumeta japonica]|uniref:Mariner Mos1 transposase n=1 Tax=Eumeta variegata TaxID=151549 RepID=A0A4C1YFX9_EUMVA|nr:hypothetical protein EVAR_54192_1 [Eumeta japonica]
MSRTQPKSDSCQKNFEANGCLFFGINGHMVTVHLENRKMVNLVGYATICLSEVFDEIRNNNRRRRIIFQYDNTSCLTLAETTQSMEGQKIELMGHEPYSSDLASNDFVSVENNLYGQHFSSCKETVHAFKICVLEIAQPEREKCY